jgi:NAD dependent epimerase/dehydratase family enzyme
MVWPAAGCFDSPYSSFFMQNLHIVIAGGSGFIGTALAHYFGKQNRVILLTRGSHTAHNNRYCRSTGLPPGVEQVYWNGKDTGDWCRCIDGCDMVINLAGQSVNCRYTSRNKAALLSSRTQTTKAIGAAIQQAVRPPALWINAASATIYRHSTLQPQDELTGEISPVKRADEYASGYDAFSRRLCLLTGAWRNGRTIDDFSVQVCRLWEQTFFSQVTPATRKIALRMAITLGEGGVMVPYLNLCKWALGGPQGNGSQRFSWIHIEDVCRIAAFVWQHPELEGVFNASSPHAVTNSVFMQTLRKITHNRLGLPAPVWLLQAGAKLIGTETELLLKSRWVVPARLQQAGFTFRYPGLEEALAAIVTPLPRRRYHLF